MSTTELHPIAQDYLERLAEEGQRLPTAIRRELMADLHGHLREATRPDMSNIEVLGVLDRLGDPHEIVAAHTPEPARGPVMRPARGTHEWAAIILLLVGGFLWGIGWIVGVVLLWTSSAWRVKDKLIGTFLLPGGLAALVAVLVFGVGSGSVSVCGSGSPALQITQGSSGASGTFTQTGSLFGTSTATPAGVITLPSCNSGGPSTIGVILAIIAGLLLLLIPIATAIYLAKRAAAAQPLA
jgi:hypothetical protein